MLNWTQYFAWVATIISVAGLGYLSKRNHDPRHPRTLSEIAVLSGRNMWIFRLILWLCGSLFAVTMYGFIGPKIPRSALILNAWTITYVSEVMLAVLPARSKTLQIHTWLARLMGTGMLALAFLFATHITGGYGRIELAYSGGMTALAMLTIIDARRFIVYELAFISISHFSIVLAALSLR